jgi:hypothetical protein
MAFNYNTQRQVQLPLLELVTTDTGGAIYGHVGIRNVAVLVPALVDLEIVAVPLERVTGSSGDIASFDTGVVVRKGVLEGPVQVTHVVRARNLSRSIHTCLAVNVHDGRGIVLTIEKLLEGVHGLGEVIYLPLGQGVGHGLSDGRRYSARCQKITNNSVVIEGAKVRVLLEELLLDIRV